VPAVVRVPVVVVVVRVGGAGGAGGAGGSGGGGSGGGGGGGGRRPRPSGPPGPPGPRPPGPPAPRPGPPGPRPPGPPGPGPRPPSPGSACCDTSKYPKCTPEDLSGWMKREDQGGSPRCDPCALDPQGNHQMCSDNSSPCSFTGYTCYTQDKDGVHCVNKCGGGEAPGNCTYCKEPIEREKNPSSCIRENKNFPENRSFCCSNNQVDQNQMCIPDWKRQSQKECPPGYQWDSTSKNGRSCYKCPSGQTDDRGMCIWF